MVKNTDKKFEFQTNRNRTFSEQFRREKVKELLLRRITIKELCSLYGISRSAVYKWLYLYGNVEKGTKTVIEMESEAKKTQHLQVRLAELERIIGQKQLEIDYLNKTLDIASEEAGYDIKKKFAPRSLNGFDKTDTPTG